ncbi:MAG TPA: DUF4266 domain-containing protein [Polyangia bacterium]|nr:DUF4266 domain-containing protein [Polyangia bacterium]
MQRRTQSRLTAASGPRRASVVAVALLAALALGAVGCARPPPVRPWQRAYLSKRALRFDADRLEQRFRQHMFGAREGSDLGYGQPGGGCGCN